MIHKILALCKVMVGYCIKWKIDIFGPGKIYPLERKDDGSNYIVSLTSYGRRVHKTVYYTLVSILKQSLRPNRIILWLSADKWSEDNLPQRLKKLEKYGVEYRFCEDIRSYTKLIPTLKIAPKDVIVTVDDDIIYSKDLLCTLNKEHEKYPTSICCTKAVYLAFSDKGTPAPYKTWEIAKNSKLKPQKILFPLGVNGILYPSQSLHEDVLCQDCFMKICPNADDIWFWAMARKKGTEHRLTPKKTRQYSFDDLYQFFHKGSALAHGNRKRGMNDVQLCAVLEKYPVL
ncbi:MAG: glycosyltransferase family 2 protein [Bacteroidales bacterium]|nr:glycosyltransferase family 2 protein [Bacteroidales bacterium]